MANTYHERRNLWKDTSGLKSSYVLMVSWQAHHVDKVSPEADVSDSVRDRSIFSLMPIQI